MKKNHKISGFTACSIGFSTKTKEIWIGCSDGMVRQLSSADFSQVGEFQGHETGKAVNHTVMSPDGSKVATGDSYRKIGIWDAEGRVRNSTIGA